MNQETFALKQAKWLSELQFKALPQTTITLAKLCLLDFLGVALRGSTLPQVKPALIFAQSSQAPFESTIVGGNRTTAPYAAYINGTFGHSCEFDDCHFHAGHPGVCVIPACIALGEKNAIGGKELIKAIVTGYQAMVWSIGPIHQRTLEIGWHGTKVGGVFGAAAAGSVILELSKEACANALAIAASDSSGTMEYDQSGGEIKRFHAGIASRAGTEAALLAEAGLTGPMTIFEGIRGIHRLFSDGNMANIESYWNDKFHIEDTMFKLYPCAGTLHAALDCVNDIRGRTPINPKDINEIEVGLADWALPHGAAIVKPHDVISAQFSLAFSIGLQFVTGENAFQDYMNPKRWTDEAIIEIAKKVRPVAAATPANSSELFAKVKIKKINGQEESAEQAAPRGFPTNPASEEELKAKFRSLTTGLLATEKIDAILESIDSLEKQTDLSFITAAFSQI